MEWTDYSADSARPERWNAPAQPDNVIAGPSVDDMLSRKQGLMTMEGEPINVAGRTSSCCETGRCSSDAEYEYCEQNNPQSVNAYEAIFDENEDKMEPIPTIPQDVLRSQAARAGIDGVMNDFEKQNDAQVGYQNKVQKQRNRRVTANVTEAIALELGANANISVLENEWEKILSKNEEEILNAYVNNIVVSGKYIKVLTDEGKVITVNPVTYCMDRISGTNFDENKIKTFLDWINFYIFDPS